MQLDVGLCFWLLIWWTCTLFWCQHLQKCCEWHSAC